MASVLPLAGPWTFADTNWNLQSQVMTREDVDRRLNELSNASPGADVAELPDISPELSDYVAKLQLTPVDRAGNIVYLLDKPTFKAELVVRELVRQNENGGNCRRIAHNCRRLAAIRAHAAGRVIHIMKGKTLTCCRCPPGRCAAAADLPMMANCC